MSYLSASAVVIHYEEALYQVYAHLPLPLPLPRLSTTKIATASDANAKYYLLYALLSRNGLISRFLSSTCTEVSGVENIGQCGRLSRLSWRLGAL